MNCTIEDAFHQDLIAWFYGVGCGTVVVAGCYFMYVTWRMHRVVKSFDQEPPR